MDRRRDYRNVSIEVMDYRPWRLEDILYGNHYQAIEDAPVWELQTRGNEKGVDIPTPEQVGYFGERTESR